MFLNLTSTQLDTQKISIVTLFYAKLSITTQYSKNIYVIIILLLVLVGNVLCVHSVANNILI